MAQPAAPATSPANRTLPPPPPQTQTNSDNPTNKRFKGSHLELSLRVHQLYGGNGLDFIGSAVTATGDIKFSLSDTHYLGASFGGGILNQLFSDGSKTKSAGLVVGVFHRYIFADFPDALTAMSWETHTNFFLGESKSAAVIVNSGFNVRFAILNLYAGAVAGWQNSGLGLGWAASIGLAIPI